MREINYWGMWGGEEWRANVKNKNWWDARKKWKERKRRNNENKVKKEKNRKEA